MNGSPADAIGWFTYGTSYLRAAQTLSKTAFDAEHRSAPIELLYYHSIELLLKAYLVHNGATESEVKSLGHKLVLVSGECERRGLSLTELDRATIALISQQGNQLRARYIKFGSFSRASFKDLDKLATRLVHTLHDLVLAGDM